LITSCIIEVLLDVMVGVKEDIKENIGDYMNEAFGSKVFIKCHNCNAWNLITDNFCKSCGVALTEDTGE
ncbi:MAG: hypothetical protein R6U10_06490, partial [Thermoplasmatota archaeon]